MAKKEKAPKQLKQKKPIYKKWWFWVIVVFIVIGIFTPKKDSTDSNSKTTEATVESHIYDNAEVKDVMNGTRNDKIGEYSIIRITSEEATEEALTDWYFNYVDKNEFNWCMILYTDKDNNMGVYSIKGMVEKDLYFNEDEYGDYSVGESSNSIMYVPTEEGTLKEMVFDESESAE